MLQPKKYNHNVEKSTVVNLEKGKIPPQAIDLEEVVLGACFIDKFAITQAAEVLGDVNCFYKEQHQIIYNTMLEMLRESEPIDLLTLSSKLKSLGKLDKVGGDFYLISLTQKVSSSAHLEHHCRIIMQMHVKRESIRVASQIIENAYNEETDIFDLLADSQREIDNVAQWLVRKKPQEFKSTVDSIFEEPEVEEGLPSKLNKIQSQTGGFSAPDLIIVAARPGMGKTAYMLNEAKHKAKLGVPVGIFSLEMSAKQLTERMLAEECGIDSKVIKQRKWNDHEWRMMQEKRKEFEKLPIYIHDQAGLSPMEMKLQAGKWKRENGVKMVFIDYLQLMNASGKNITGNREQEISYISRSTKATAKELEIPIMALSQLSRAVEQRGGMKRPLLSDLRESGAIEQDADTVVFLLRPEYYRITEWDDDNRTSTKGQCEISFAKNRSGEVFSLVAKSNLKYMRFEDVEDEDDIWEPLPPAPQSTQDAFDPAVDDNLPNDDNDDLPF